MQPMRTSFSFAASAPQMVKMAMVQGRDSRTLTGRAKGSTKAYRRRKPCESGTKRFNPATLQDKTKGTNSADYTRLSSLRSEELW
ncbi:hypothetical protein GJAV_G00229060 [Gymnothorax javanicus]|nr:hypothetical protein GJAV_G00229060 [Gymnothorax javanicus]